MEENMKNTQTGMPKEQGRTAKKFPVKPLMIAGAVLALIIICMVIEAVNTRKLVIVNNTKSDIESIQLYFEDMEDDTFYILKDKQPLSVEAGSKYSGSFVSSKEMAEYGSFLMIDVKFADKEMVQTYAGYFTRTFTGKIKLEFNDSGDGNISMDIKAGDGLFQTTKYTDCDETQELFED